MKLNPMTTLRIGLQAMLALSVCVSITNAQTVFHYNYSAVVGTELFDIGGVGNNAVLGPAAVISTDVPTEGVPPVVGLSSLDSSDAAAAQGNQAGAVTTAVSLLDNDRIEAAGGFTYETWFKWNGGGAVNSIIDYAGTDKLVIDQRNGASTVLAMRMDPVDLPIANVEADQWHYVAFVFDTSGNTQVGDTIMGQATAYFDGLDAIDLGTATKSAFGDSLVRSIGIGQHPIGFNLDFFNGKVFETRVSLGALAPSQLLYVPEPCSAVAITLGMVLIGLGSRRKAV